MPDLLGTAASDWLEYLPILDRAALSTAFHYEIMMLKAWEQATIEHGANATKTSAARSEAVRAAGIKHNVVMSAMHTAKSIITSGITDVTTEMA